MSHYYSSQDLLSAHSQRPTRRRPGPGAHQSSLSPFKTRDLLPRDAARARAEEQSKTQTRNHATSSQSHDSSHFTAIPARPRRSSIVSSRSSPRRPSIFPATSTTTTKTWTDDDDRALSLSFIAHLDVENDDPVASPTGNLNTLSKSHFSRVITNIQHLATSLARSALSSLRQKRRSSFSLPANPRNPSLPIASNTKNSFEGLERGLTPTEKLTHKWPRPRSSRSAAPWLRNTNPFLPRGLLRELRGGAGGWSQGQMEVILRDSRGLGINWVGQWTFQKWCLLASVTTVFLLGLTCLVFSLLTWFAAYPVAPILLITDSPALVLLTFSSSLLLLASLAGITGTLLNSRPILAVYVLLLFPSFLSFVSVGYLTYKKATFSLDAKVSEAWHHWYSPSARSVLQGALGCCGWSSPLHGAAASGTCYARSPLPGCHGPLVRFERDVLASVAGTLFSLVPLHLGNILVGLLCANHVTYRFGKGIMPARYRLTAHDVNQQGVMKRQLGETDSGWPGPGHVPPPPFPAPKGHSTFREDRRGVPPGVLVTTCHRHRNARAKDRG